MPNDTLSNHFALEHFFRRWKMMRESKLSRVCSSPMTTTATMTTAVATITTTMMVMMMQRSKANQLIFMRRCFALRCFFYRLISSTFFFFLLICSFVRSVDFFVLRTLLSFILFLKSANINLILFLFYKEKKNGTENPKSFFL